MEWLYEDKEEMDIERRARLPDERFFKSNDLLEAEALSELEESVEGAKTVVLSDEDADGLGVALAVKQKHPDVEFVPCGPHTNEIDMDTVLETVASKMNESGVVYIGDICPDDIESIQPLVTLAEKASEIYWWDHHEWQDSVKEFVEDNVTSLVVDSTEENERCAAQIALDELEKMGVEFSPAVSQTIAVTAVYDLWKKVTDENGDEQTEFIDERARDLNDFVSIIEDYDTYFETVEEYGPDVMEAPQVREEIADYRVEQKQLEAIAISNANFHEVGEYSVAVTYGRCPQNTVADGLRQRGADLVIVVKPSGGISFRGADDGFTECHKIAEKFDGGGHEKAAGGFLCPKNDSDYDRWETDMLDYASHWTTNGEDVREHLVETVEEYVS